MPGNHRIGFDTDIQLTGFLGLILLINSQFQLDVMKMHCGRHYVYLAQAQKGVLSRSSTLLRPVYVVYAERGFERFNVEVINQGPR